MARVVVIVLCWKSADRIAGCLDSLQRQTFTDFELVVVDNASTDGSIEVVQSLWPSATVLRQQTNTGFTGGVNRGLRYLLDGPAEFAWQLNDDTAFDSNVLADLVALADRPGGPALVSPVLVDAQARMPFGLKSPYPAHREPKSRYRSGHPDEAFMLPGTALLIRREVFERIGLLDERYFLYWEDNDFCLRADRAGFSGAYCPGAVVHHATGMNVPARGEAALYFLTRNRLLFECGHSPRWTWPRRYLSTLGPAIRKTARRRDDGRTGSADAILAGAWDGIMGKTGGPYDPGRGVPPAIERIFLARNGFLGELMRRRYRAAMERARGRHRLRPLPARPGGGGRADS